MTQRVQFQEVHPKISMSISFMLGSWSTRLEMFILGNKKTENEVETNLDPITNRNVKLGN